MSSFLPGWSWSSPIPASPSFTTLFKLPNVILTPHSAGPTWDNWAKAYRNGFDNIQRMEAGQAPLWVVPELQGLLG